MDYNTIVFDEAGNTGSNLLDSNQPIFVLSSTRFTSEETDELHSFFDTNAQELHFSNLKKSSRHRKSLIKFLNHEYITESKVKSYIADKRFSLYVRIVDFLVEPAFHNRGIDFYQNGMNIAYSNLFYVWANSVWKEAHVKNLEASFLNMIRSKSEKSVEEFNLSVNTLYEQYDSRTKRIIEPIIISQRQNLFDLSIINKYSVDLMLPCFITLIDQWHKELNSEFYVLYDDSKQIEFWQELIKQISNPQKIQETKVGYDYRQITYPLKIIDIEPKSSLESKEIQLSDLIASALCYAFKEKLKGSINSLAKDIFSSKAIQIMNYPLLPTSNVTPEDLGITDSHGIDPNSFIANQLGSWMKTNQQR